VATDTHPVNADQRHAAAPCISVVVPTYNERANIAPLVAAVRDVLGDVPWEMVVVDDDSRDGTYDEVLRIAQTEPRLRCLRRVGRRGLSSAVTEGVLVANADVIAVMDADFQHDETRLPIMYRRLLDEGADLVVGTRYAGEGGVGDWDATRARMSGFANDLSRRLTGYQTTDPVSGFFLIRRAVFVSTLYGLSQQGYKILIDILTSATQPLKVIDVPYVFRSRAQGESKISALVLAEFAFLLIDKITRGWIPPRFVLFAGVGGLGLLVHLAVLFNGARIGMDFITAQGLATFSAMLFNYVLNNEFTYRDRRLVGWKFVRGLVLFVVICSVGALANVGVAELAIERTHSWTIAGIGGALMGAVFNFGAASSIVWGQRKPRRAAAPQ
jgi:dolichol-phosphate mannosyltransferase